MNTPLNTHDNWETPKELYNTLDAEFHFDFDPCPLNHNMSWDGLKIEWGSSNFVNPPYSRKLKEAFIMKAIEESKKGKLSVILVPVSTSTKIFHEYIYMKYELRFLKGRPKFKGLLRDGRISTQSGQKDCMLIIIK
jgi:hypothetical protein